MSNQNYRVVAYRPEQQPEVHVGKKGMSKKEAQRVATDLVQNQGYDCADVVEVIFTVNAP